MAFFGQNTSRSTAQFAQDMSGFRKDTEARNLQTEIDQVGREVMQVLAGVKPEDMADAMPKIAQQLKAKNYSERALVAGINLAMGYTKASLSNQQSKAATQASAASAKTSENRNAAYADEQAVKGALADIQQHPTGIPYSAPEEYNKTRLGQLTPTQQYSALGAQTAAKTAATNAKMTNDTSLAKLAKLKAETNAISNPTGSSKDQTDAYNRNVQSIMIQTPGLQTDVEGRVSGLFKKEDALKLKQLADNAGVALYNEQGEPLDESFWQPWKADTPRQKITLMPQGTSASQTTPAQTTPAQTTPAQTPLSTAALKQLIDNPGNNLPAMGPQNNPSTIGTQTMPTQGQTQQPVQQPAQVGNNLFKLPQNQAATTPMTPQTLRSLMPKPVETFVNKGKDLGATVKHKTKDISLTRKTTPDTTSLPAGQLNENHPGIKSLIKSSLDTANVPEFDRKVLKKILIKLGNGKAFTPAEQQVYNTYATTMDRPRTLGSTISTNPDLLPKMAPKQ